MRHLGFWKPKVIVEDGGMFYWWFSSIVSKGWEVEFEAGAAGDFLTPGAVHQIQSEADADEDIYLDAIKHTFACEEWPQDLGVDDQDWRMAQSGGALKKTESTIMSRGCLCTTSRSRCCCCGRTLRERFGALMETSQQTEQPDQMWLSEGINSLVFEPSHESDQLAWLYR